MIRRALGSCCSSCAEGKTCEGESKQIGCAACGGKQIGCATCGGKGISGLGVVAHGGGHGGSWGGGHGGHGNWGGRGGRVVVRSGGFIPSYGYGYGYPVYQNQIRQCSVEVAVDPARLRALAPGQIIPLSAYDSCGNLITVALSSTRP